ncbi:MAG: CDP-alcohol phosphatidyltransferase family protein [Clostridiales bacterium]|nr:CDP-alcohol phosphatidyltransferase family protein [Clostridiales bacterium]
MSKDANKLGSGECKFCIGYYNRSVVLTFLGLAFAVVGICFAYVTNLTWSVVCLIVAGVCDMFDGKVARACKGRSEEEKDFGVQIDSLTDTVAFVVLPVLISLEMGHQGPFSIAICVLYVLAGVIRLGFFNVLVAHRDNSEPLKNYTGLPVTSAAIIFPAIWLISRFVSRFSTTIMYDVVMFLTAVLFVSRLKIRKPKGAMYYVFTVVAVIGIAVLIYLQYWR